MPPMQINTGNSNENKRLNAVCGTFIKFTTNKTNPKSILAVSG
jgi:hypothetical protein